jgi:hypothetical protein
MVTPARPLLHRLHEPFPELEQLAQSFNLSEVDDVTHRHIPFGGGGRRRVPCWRQRHPCACTGNRRNLHAASSMVSHGGWALSPGPWPGLHRAL